MKTIRIISLSAAIIGLTVRAVACGGAYGQISLSELAWQATSDDPEISQAAIARLRARGPAGLQAVLKIYDEQTALAAAGNKPAINGEEWARVKAAIEAVGQQRDCEASRLFWYTDLEQAQAAAEASGKPILSLRLLGKLNEEYSCANSRFFRTTLYANREVSAYLRDHFILHWKSVRPVPRITVDFGDGRRIERTITGNSIHYVLDARGKVIDALPGLYGPTAFLAGIKKAEAQASLLAKVEPTQRAAILRAYHVSGGTEIETAWARDLRLIQNGPQATAFSVAQVPFSKTSTPARTPSAERAGAVSRSKSAIESPLLKSTRPGARIDAGELQADSNDVMWKKIAALHTSEAVLDNGSRDLIRSKNPTAPQAARAAIGKSRVEDPLLRSLRNLEKSISEDTMKNEYLLHSQIHRWLAVETAPDLDQLNKRVYAELFLTPDSDPWLGLAPADTYSALDNDGLIISQNR